MLTDRVEDASVAMCENARDFSLNSCLDEKEYFTAYMKLACSTVFVYFSYNHKNYNFLDCDWFRKLLFLTNSLVKLLSDSLLSDTLLSDSLLSDSSISQSHSKLS